MEQIHFTASEYRLETIEARVRMGDNINYLGLWWAGTEPEEADVPNEVYPGAALAVTSRRAQIWTAQPRTYENLGLSIFARYDAYKTIVCGVDVWIAGEFCAEIDELGRPSRA